MALPAYNADGDSQTDHLAGPNQNDEGLDSVHDFTKSSLAAKTAKTDDYLPNKRSENPDVMGLNSLGSIPAKNPITQILMNLNFIDPQTRVLNSF